MKKLKYKNNRKKSFRSLNKISLISIKKIKKEKEISIKKIITFLRKVKF
jgi:hypothetical protein